MLHDSPEIHAAVQFAEQASETLLHSQSFAQLDPNARMSLLRDLGSIRRALRGHSDPYALSPSPTQIQQPRGRQVAVVSSVHNDPYALALETPNDLARRRALLRNGTTTNDEQPPSADNGATNEGNADAPRPRTAATETLASRAGALSDEIDFPAFVAGLVHGTFDAMVDAAIRQMEAFAELVSAVAKDVDRFTSENVTPNQVRDWLAEQYPRDLVLEVQPSQQPRLRRRTTTAAATEDDGYAPAWLADYGLEGEALTDELIEETLVPMARRRVGESRLQTLATMVLLGMNRIIIRDGTISAKVRFRASARDRASVDYAISQDPGGKSWGSRGSGVYNQSSMMVSTVGVNVQAETDLKAELFGEVRINFVSETLPLDRFVDSAQLSLLQRNARTGSNPVAPTSSNPAPTTPPSIMVPPPTPPTTGGS